MKAPLRLLAVLVLLWPATAVARPLTPAERAQVDALVSAALAKSHAPSASVAVVRGGEVAFEKTYGDARLAPARPATATARFDIGSVSKQFTAALVLMLADEGKLSLDDPVSRHLPGLTGGDRITVRQLLAQTSGYQNYWVVNYLPPHMRVDIAPEAIVQRWGRMPLDFEPGARWAYSNTNYTIAGRIVERIEGRPLAAVLQTRIFDPLGMTTARAGTQPPFDAADAQGYTRRLDGPVREAARVPAGWLFGAGGLSMSAGDLARWDAALLSGRLLGADSRRAMQTEAALTDGSAPGYGLGVYVRRRGERRVISHDGVSIGFLTENRIYPDDGLAIAVAVNADYGRAQLEIADGIEAMLLGPAPAPPAPAAAAEAPTKPAKPVHAATTTLARTIFDDLAAGRLNEAHFTADGASAFDAAARDDIRRTLAPLGRPERFELVRHEPWNGYDASIHEIGWPSRILVLIMFRTADGKVEDYHLFSPD